MKAFVTGSTGLLGNNLVRMLRAQGHEVKALVRSREKGMKLLGDTGAELIVGYMEDVSAFAPELANCDVLFHTAAYFREYYGLGDHWQKLEQINVRGTIQVLEAAEKYGVKKAIYVSSSTVIGKSSTGSSDESTPPDERAEINLYAKSKVLAEQAVADFLKIHSLPVVLMLPSAMFGPGDAAPTAAGRVILDFLHRKLPALPPGGFNVVDVRDVAQAMINAVEHGRSGERYILSLPFYTVGEIVQLLSQISGVPVPRQMSYAMAMAFAWLSEGVARITGREPQVTVNAVRVLQLRDALSSRKAVNELGATFRPFEDTIRDEVQWYIDHGYVKVDGLPKQVRVVNSAT